MFIFLNSYSYISYQTSKEGIVVHEEGGEDNIFLYLLSHNKKGWL